MCDADCGRPYLRYVSAVHFAVTRHAGGRRRDGATPHWVHGLRTAEILRTEAGITDWDVLIAAVLHDLIEETGTKYEDIAAAFGARVADIVAELTDDKRLPKQQRKSAMVEGIPQLSGEGKLVKLADRLDNTRDEWLRSSPSLDAARVRSTFFAETGEVLRGLKGVNPRLEALLRHELEADRRHEDGQEPGQAAEESQSEDVRPRVGDTR